jgi:hypothetical protein
MISLVVGVFVACNVYQIGPFVLRSQIELPYLEVDAQDHHATLEVSDRYPRPPMEYQFADGTIRAEVGWWNVFNRQVSSFVSMKGEIVLAPKGQGGSVYLHALCAIRNFLMQQRVMLLHGSAVARDGEAVVWLGENGFGKSTAAAMEVTLRGSVHLSDDVVPLCVDGSGQVVTFQCDRYAHLATPLSQGLESLAEALPRYTEVRRDGKGMYLLSPPDCSLYPIRHVIHPGFGLGSVEPVEVGSKSFKGLISAVVNLDLTQKFLGPEHLTRLAKMVAQSADHERI